MSRILQCFSVTEGQLYQALVCWADHWIKRGRYQTLQEAISEFIPRDDL